MSGRNAIGAKPSRTVEQRREFQVAVAVGARQRGAAGCILPNEVRHDRVVELALEIQDVMGNSQRGGDPASVIQIVERAATAERLTAALIV